jgi:ubiquitin C-terminal hydrolase
MDVPERETQIQGGIANYGASCYINATLQCLIAVPEFEPRPTVRTAYAEIKRVMDSGNSPTEKQIQSLLDAANVQEDGAPRGTTLTVSNQADANELMLAIGASDRSPFAFDIRKTLFYNDARGQARESESVDPASQLTLRLDNSGVTSVVSLMNDFFDIEELPDRIGRNPEDKQTSQKGKASLSSTPPVLVVHLARFLDVSTKNDLEVTFRETLHVEKYAADGARVTYDLFAAVIHEGTIQSGHYWALVKKNGAWRKYDDQRVTEANFDTVLKEGKGGKRRPTAYVLLYRKEA